jgi:hypothetical protein
VQKEVDEGAKMSSVAKFQIPPMADGGLEEAYMRPIIDFDFFD